MIALTLETISGGKLMSRWQAYWLVGALLAVIALSGFVLWWPPGAPANSSNQLGSALLVATIVALAVLVAEYLVSAQMRGIAARNSLGLRRSARYGVRKPMRRCNGSVLRGSTSGSCGSWQAFSKT